MSRLCLPTFGIKATHASARCCSSGRMRLRDCRKCTIAASSSPTRSSSEPMTAPPARLGAPEDGSIDLQAMPDRQVSVRDVFGIDSPMVCPAFSERNNYVPERDEVYRFDAETTLAILAGFAYNRRVLVQ